MIPWFPRCSSPPATCRGAPLKNRNPPSPARHIRPGAPEAEAAARTRSRRGGAPGRVTVTILNARCTASPGRGRRSAARGAGSRTGRRGSPAYQSGDQPATRQCGRRWSRRYPGNHTCAAMSPPLAVVLRNSRSGRTARARSRSSAAPRARSSQGVSRPTSSSPGKGRRVAAGSPAPGSTGTRSARPGGHRRWRRGARSGGGRCHLGGGSPRTSGSLPAGARRAEAGPDTTRPGLRVPPPTRRPMGGAVAPAGLALGRELQPEQVRPRRAICRGARASGPGPGPTRATGSANRRPLPIPGSRTCRSDGT